MSSNIRGRLVCEDRSQESFFVKLLEPMFGKRLDVKIAPSGQGAASAWVLKQYPIHVRGWIRLRRSEERVALVTVVDGDNVGVAARLRSLDLSLKAAGEAGRLPLERIAICVPTWSIETWLLFLGGETTIDELQSYKPRTADRLSSFNVIALAKDLRERTGSALPSMDAAITELRRVRS